MTEVCNDVQLEPDLQPLTGEQLTYTTANVEDGARLDIAANGFWGGRYERTFTVVGPAVHFNFSTGSLRSVEFGC